MLYEFKCACGHTFEKRFSFDDIVHSTRCPSCGRLAERKFTPIRHEWKSGQKPE